MADLQFDYKACIATNTPTRTISLDSTQFKEYDFTELTEWIKQGEYKLDLENSTPIIFNTPDELTNTLTGYMFVKALWKLKKKVINLSIRELIALAEGKSDVLENHKQLNTYDYLVVSDFLNQSLLYSGILELSRGYSYAVSELLMNFIFNKGTAILGTTNLDSVKHGYNEGLYLYLRKYQKKINVIKAVKEWA